MLGYDFYSSAVADILTESSLSTPITVWLREEFPNEEAAGLGGPHLQHVASPLLPRPPHRHLHTATFLGLLACRVSEKYSKY